MSLYTAEVIRYWEPLYKSIVNELKSRKKERGCSTFTVELMNCRIVENVKLMNNEDMNREKGDQVAFMRGQSTEQLMYVQLKIYSQ